MPPRLLRGAAILFASGVLTQLIGLPAGIFTRSVLGPRLIGIISALELVSSYAQHVGLGVTRSASREVPQALGREDRVRASRLASTSLGFSTAAGPVAAILIIGFGALLLGGSSRPEVITALLVYGAVAIPGQLREHFLMIARTEERFEFIAVVAVSVAIVYGILAVFGSWFWGIYGFLTAVAIQRLFRTAANWFFVRQGTAFAIHRTELSSLVISGLPMAVAAIAFSLATTADDLMVLTLLGQEALGIYSIAILGRAYLWQVGNAVGSVWGARIQYLLGRDQDPIALWGLIFRQVAFISLVLPLAFGPMVIVAETAVFSLLPDFADGVIPLRILSIAVFLRVIRALPGNYMIALGKERISLMFGSIAAVISLAAAALALALGLGFEGAALGAVAGATVHFTATASYVASRTPRPSSNVLPFVTLVLPAIYMVAVMIATDHFAPTTEISSAGFDALRRLAQRLILYLVGMTPLAILAYQRWLKNSEDRASTFAIRRN